MFRPGRAVTVTLALALATTLTACLTACGDDADDAAVVAAGECAAAPAASGAADASAVDLTQIDGVEVAGDIGSEPTVTFAQTPFSLETSQTQVLVEGDGEAITADQTVRVQFALLNGASGEVVQSSYAQEGPVSVDLGDPQGLGYLLAALRGRNIGDRVLVGVAPADGFGEALPTDAPFTSADSLFYVVDVVGVVATVADGTPVADIPAGLPEVATDEQCRVTGITVPDGDAPTELVVQPLLRGDGPEVTADDTLTVQYWGVLWSDGSTFDSSWESGAPAEFPLSGVIAGWTEGLAGQTVGSRVLLIVPPDLGYGPDEQNGIPGGSTLVFAVDILAA